MRIDPTVLKGGYAPVFTSAWTNAIYVLLSSPAAPTTARVLTYVVNKGQLTSSSPVNVTISEPVVGFAAFPDQLFLLLASGAMQSLPLSSSSQPPSSTAVLVASPIAPPLATSAGDYHVNVPVPVVTPVVQSGPVPLMIQSASTNTATLTAGSVDGKPQLYIGDPVNHRVLDLDAKPLGGAQATATSTLTGTNGGTSGVPLQLVRQYVSYTDLSQVKGLAANTQSLTILSQNTSLQNPSPMTSLVAISNGTPIGCAA
jgi:hypothetical protein